MILHKSLQIRLGIDKGFIFPLEPVHGDGPLAEKQSQCRITHGGIRSIGFDGLNEFIVTTLGKDGIDTGFCQLDLFSDPASLEKEKALERAMVEVRKRFGMNAIVKGMNLEEGATTIERNRQIGGHKAGGSEVAPEKGK